MRAAIPAARGTANERKHQRGKNRPHLRRDIHFLSPRGQATLELFETPAKLATIFIDRAFDTDIDFPLVNADLLSHFMEKCDAPHRR
ncbi:hypothetical protein [Paraburkholderia monticola]|uniref:hypothetical protein n=1 Tax=Paraburkholderia monticola TaxID=1399968 RepID=UPI0013A58ABD|nr:hypothetical protein [Paraburkholderia monticola]